MGLLEKILFGLFAFLAFASGIWAHVLNRKKNELEKKVNEGEINAKLEETKDAVQKMDDGAVLSELNDYLRKSGGDKPQKG